MQSDPDDPRCPEGSALGVQDAARREWQALFKSCKASAPAHALTYIHIGQAVLDHLDRFLRASREAAVRVVTPLGKGLPFPARRA